MALLLGLCFMLLCVAAAALIVTRQRDLAQTTVDIYQSADKLALLSLSTAGDALLLGVLQFVAGLIGIYLIARTLSATRDAVAEAERATAAANEMLKAEINANRVALRPYVFVNAIRWEYLWHEDDMERVHSWRMICSVFNSGQTPALNMSTAISFAEFTGELPPDWDFPEPVRHPVGAIGPNQGVGTAIEFPLEALQRVYRNEGGLHFWLSIEYEDGFPGTPIRRTEKHGFVMALSNPDSKEAVLRDLFAPQFNGCDDYCFRKPGERWVSASDNSGSTVVSGDLQHPSEMPTEANRLGRDDAVA